MQHDSAGPTLDEEPKYRRFIFHEKVQASEFETKVAHEATDPPLEHRPRMNATPWEFPREDAPSPV